VVADALGDFTHASEVFPARPTVEIKVIGGLLMGAFTGMAEAVVHFIKSLNLFTAGRAKNRALFLKFIPGL